MPAVTLGVIAAALGVGVDGQLVVGYWSLVIDYWKVRKRLFDAALVR